MSSVVIRPFEDRDFEAVAGMFHETWGWELEGPESVKLDLAAYYVAGIVAKSTTLLVADVGRTAVGCAFLTEKTPREDRINRAAYMTVLKMKAHALSLDAHGRGMLAFYDKLEEVFDALVDRMQEHGKNWEVELNLLLTSCSCRGQGVGRRLVQAVAEHMCRHRQSWCMLRTDTHCDWRYYEKTGWQRAAEVCWQDDSNITAYAYRKALAQP